MAGSVLDAQGAAEEREERACLPGARLALVEEAGRGDFSLSESRGDREALALEVLDERMVRAVARRRALELLAFGLLPHRLDGIHRPSPLVRARDQRVADPLERRRR